MPISGTLIQVLAAMLRLYSLMLVVYALLSWGHARATLSSRYTLAAEHGGTSAKSD